jgi:hypothetical protein
MPISTVVSHQVDHPDVPFDKLRYRLVIDTVIDPAGKLKASCHVRLTPCRVLDADTPTETWQDDPGRRPVDKSYQDLFKAAEELAAGGNLKLAAAIQAVNEAVADINQREQLL